jgi:hypothetical protein
MDIKIVADATGAGFLSVWFDQMSIRQAFAPTVSGRAMRMLERIFIVGQKDLPFSEKNEDLWYPDCIQTFTNPTIAAIEAGKKGVVLTCEDAIMETPLQDFPDLQPDLLHPTGGVSANLCGSIVYKGTKGAWWLDTARRILFWDGVADGPICISDNIVSVLDGTSPDVTLSDDLSSGLSVYNREQGELKIFLPRPDDDGLFFALVLDCTTGDWMPHFLWHGTSGIQHAICIRDVNSRYQTVLMDLNGDIWAEGFGTGKDGEETADDGVNWTGGVALDWFIDTWWFASEEPALIFHHLFLKLRPKEVGSFNLEFATKVSEIGETASRANEPDEENLTWPSVFTATQHRHLTIASGQEECIVNRKANLEEARGHSMAVRVGQFETGTARCLAECELLGVSARAAEEGGF